MTQTTSGAQPACARQLTRPVNVGGVVVGGGAPVVIQSMTNLPMIDSGKGPILDIEGNLAQISRLADAGCELVRVAIPNRASVEAFQRVCEQSPLPVIADVHFDHEIAIGAARCGAAALRINPGNIGTQERVDAVIDAAGEAGIPIRIGVNAGSLEDAIAARQDLTQPQKLALSAAGFVDHFSNRGFDDIVISAKSHDVMTTVAAYRQLSRELPHVPLHIGVTEAGTVQQNDQICRRPGDAACRGHRGHTAREPHCRPGRGDSGCIRDFGGCGRAAGPTRADQLSHMQPVPG